MNRIFDIETDGLNSTKIHVLSWSDDLGETVNSTHDYDEMREFFMGDDTLIGHNIVRFDVPAVESVLGIKVKARLIDTLAVAWYIDHHRTRHNLDLYGEEYGVPKPKITDWENLSAEDYKHRCQEDVKINSKLWKDLSRKLGKLYKDQPEDKERLLDYLTFKMDCAAEQEGLQWKLDVAKAEGYLAEWEELKADKINQLADAMPEVVKYKEAIKPSEDKMWKKNGDMSVAGENWLDLCAEYKVPTTTVSLRVVHKRERANPNSSPQVKAWLGSLGWEPTSFKFVKGTNNSPDRSVEQVTVNGELCPSVLKLVNKDPAVAILDGLSVLSHRLGIIKGMLNAQRDGYVQASIAGFTNTMRFRHAKPLVNLPGVEKPYGAEIRGCLICPDDYVLCGADMTSLEDTTKRHYMQPHDPEYVEEMSKEGFDPHLDLAKFAGVITQEDIDLHNSGGRSLKALRKNYKVVNYSATYGIGASKLARETGMKLTEAKELLNAFWERNKAVTQVAEDTKTRECIDSLWLWNPVSRFWYALRNEKDKFSTLNQGTGVFCFDTWVSECRKGGVKVIGQFHDEVIALVKRGEEKLVETTMKRSMDLLNKNLQLNVPLGTDVQFGKSYADIH